MKISALFGLIFAIVCTLISAVHAAPCPLGDGIPVTDGNGVAQVCNAFGDVITVRGGRPNAPVPENCLFANMRCPTLSGQVEAVKPRRWKVPCSPGITPMHFVCDVPMESAKRNRR